jgi:hypothetical protein
MELPYNGVVGCFVSQNQSVPLELCGAGRTRVFQSRSALVPRRPVRGVACLFSCLWFIYDLFDDAVNSSDHIATNDRMINE